jgi:hypothetical protein
MAGHPIWVPRFFWKKRRIYRRARRVKEQARTSIVERFRSSHDPSTPWPAFAQRERKKRPGNSVGMAAQEKSKPAPWKP